MPDNLCSSQIEIAHKEKNTAALENLRTVERWLSDALDRKFF